MSLASYLAILCFGFFVPKMGRRLVSTLQDLCDDYMRGCIYTQRAWSRARHPLGLVKIVASEEWGRGMEGPPPRLDAVCARLCVPSVREYLAGTRSLRRPFISFLGTEFWQLLGGHFILSDLFYYFF